MVEGISSRSWPPLPMLAYMGIPVSAPFFLIPNSSEEIYLTQHRSKKSTHSQSRGVGHRSSYSTDQGMGTEHRTQHEPRVEGVAPGNHPQSTIAPRSLAWETSHSCNQMSIVQERKTRIQILHVTQSCCLAHHRKPIPATVRCKVQQKR